MGHPVFDMAANNALSWFTFDISILHPLGYREVYTVWKIF